MSKMLACPAVEISDDDSVCETGRSPQAKVNFELIENMEAMAAARAAPIYESR